MIIATHSGKFHADDVWAVTVLDLLFPECELIRTRNETRIASADFAVDVGGVWEPNTGRFDHHQKGFIGARPSGVIYASAGLVWREFGARCVKLIAQKNINVALDTRNAQEMANAIDHDLVQYLDMADTGAAKNAPGGYGLSAIISGFNPNWLDDQNAGNAVASDEGRLLQFRRAMDFMRDILINQIKYRVGAMLSGQQVRLAEKLEDGQVLFLKNGALPWATIVRNEMPNVLFVIGYSIAEDRYMLNTVPSSAETFDARKDLPAAWAGLRDEELAIVSGVSDAMFCHNGLFIAAAKSFEGARQMARLALREALAV